MLHSHIAGGRWRLLEGSRLLLVHRPDQPFVSAIRQEKTYTADRGSVKTQVVESRRIALRTLREEEDGTLRFSSEGHSLRVRLTEEAHGVTLQFEGEPGWSYEFCLPAEKDEAVFGGGEQYRQVNLRGEQVVNFVSEHIKASTVIEKAVVPRPLYREKSHGSIGSYAPMPVFVTDRGRMIFFDTGCDGLADLTGDDALLFAFDACPNRLTLLLGKSFRELSAMLAERIPNRQYLPGWCHDGMILGIQGGSDTILKKCFAMLDAGAKVTAVWSQDWSGELRTVMGKQVWWNWEVDSELYPDLKGVIQKLNARGVRFLAYINPYLVKDGKLYNYCRDKGWLITRKDGSVYHIKSTTFDAGMLDLTHPEAVRYIKETLIGKNMLDLGVSGWMADFGEYLPVDCVLHDGDPKMLHNEWPVLWAKINREVIEEYGAEDAFFFSRSGYLGVQNYAPILWNGDQHTDTTKDYGLPCVMPASFSLAFSGVTMVHCDIGGFFSFGKIRRDAELFTRWMEMGCFSLLMRSHESIRPWANAQFDARAVKPYTVKLTRLHAALRPYIEHVAEEAAKGVPALRPDFWEKGSFAFSQDPYSYFLGDDLFVCPVIRRGVRHRTVHLPEGDWVGLWTGRSYAPGTHRVNAPLGHPPVFYRRDSAYSELFRRSADGC